MSDMDKTGGSQRRDYEDCSLQVCDAAYSSRLTFMRRKECEVMIL
jgi:hypothetical protein